MACGYQELCSKYFHKLRIKSISVSLSSLMFLHNFSCGMHNLMWNLVKNKMSTLLIGAGEILPRFWNRKAERSTLRFSIENLKILVLYVLNHFKWQMEINWSVYGTAQSQKLTAESRDCLTPVESLRLGLVTSQFWSYIFLGATRRHLRAFLFESYNRHSVWPRTVISILNDLVSIGNVGKALA
jgi:hypothetical protein